MCSKCETPAIEVASNLCHRCGNVIKLSDLVQTGLIMQGFREASDETLMDDGNDLDTLRAKSHASSAKRRKVKEGTVLDSSDEEVVPGSVHTVHGILEHVWALQESISSTFRNGQPLDNLIEKLRNSAVDPMTDDFLILNVAVAKIRIGSVRHVRYLAYDHRRLWCMYHAGCQQIRVRIKPGMYGPHFDELVRKSNGICRKITEVVKRERR